MTFASDRLSENNEKSAEKNYNEQIESKKLKTSRFKFDPIDVMASLRSNIIGQNDSMQEIENMLHVVKSDFGDPNRPLSVTLMLGPTGVGKTETVRLISQAIHGNLDTFCRIDMNTLAQEHYMASLTGAPPGYVGSKEGNTLFNIEAIQGSFSKPGIILFDEIEKASNEVIRALLNVLDTGVLKLTAGNKEISFKNCMIFMTSNIGAKKSQERRNQINKLPKLLRMYLERSKISSCELTTKALKSKFDPEFINRIDRILNFNAIDGQNFEKIVEIEIKKLNERLSKYDFSVFLTPSAIEFLALNYMNEYGARGIARSIRVNIDPLISKTFNQSQEKICLKIDLVSNKLLIVDS